MLVFDEGLLITLLSTFVTGVISYAAAYILFDHAVCFGKKLISRNKK